MFGKFLVGVRVGPLDIVTEESLSAELVQALPAAPKHARIVMRFLDHAFHVTGDGVDLEQWLVRSVQKAVTVESDTGQAAGVAALADAGPADEGPAEQDFADRMAEELQCNPLDLLELMPLGAGREDCAEFLAALGDDGGIDDGGIDDGGEGATDAMEGQTAERLKPGTERFQEQRQSPK